MTLHRPKNSVRIITAASLFDGHDASINIMRRLLQEQGAEVIHLGHNRSVHEVVKAVLQEGAQGVCISSYQGGHMEYFKFLKDLLDAAGAHYVRIFGGGGGVIIHDEKKALEEYGIAQIFHPDDGRRLGLDGMISMIIEQCDFDITTVDITTKSIDSSAASLNSELQLGLALSQIEKKSQLDANQNSPSLRRSEVLAQKCPILGITGTGGAGKSSLIDELIQRYLNVYPDKKIAVVCVDPSKRKTGGSLLGDRIRMNSLRRERVFMRSLASRGSGREIANSLVPILEFLRTQDFDFIIAETSGIGQGNMAITEVSDFSLYVMTSDFGAQSQLEKIDMIDFADLIAVNKADRRGAQDALRDVSKQYRRSRKLQNSANLQKSQDLQKDLQKSHLPHQDDEAIPVFLTQASQFNDEGVNRMFFYIADLLKSRQGEKWNIDPEIRRHILSAEEHVIIPSERQGYLAEIAYTIKKYKDRTNELAEAGRILGALQKVKSFSQLTPEQEQFQEQAKGKFDAAEWALLQSWDKQIELYSAPEMIFKVRDKEIRQPLLRETLSGLHIRRVALPQYSDLGDRFRFLRLENFPGEFPFTAGVFPLKRADEDPKRMFAGEGTPDRTNKRFHYLCKGESAHRLSTAFDSVTLYGNDPDTRPDIFGKVGESGVNVCTLDDMKKLYAGFDLCSASTSVSMTINGPAPMILAFYFNTAIDQQISNFESLNKRKVNDSEYQQIFERTLQTLRGTVQADILKEDQGQNTCIFSINFALKMMGDMQEYFVQKQIRNFYSVSISGYHIAEAGANPISQLAFTLSNGFTFVEYYLSRGLPIDEFAPNLSFFFSNGLDPEYTVLGRVARRIWAIAIKELYKGNERSQKLKYHIQTSGRSLHAQEIDFNDIRTTLQALLALYDNCNSLHTNAYDEAITTPTEESVRRAMAIQMIINREFGLMKNENSLQGSFVVDELTEMVEEAVLSEFRKINDRGGVLGAMETQYQRSKIQEESLYYEKLKHDGTLPIIGVNTFIDPKTLGKDYVPPKIELARASQDEKNHQLHELKRFQKENEIKAKMEIENLKKSVLGGKNIFASLMQASRHCSLFQMTEALFEVGGQYRRNV